MRKGFTLIELMVVISVIAILSGIILSVINVGRIRDRARDSVRREDLATISSVYERYYSDKNTYPGGNVAARNALLVPDYIRVIPVDPESGDQYPYGQYNNGQSFCICTRLKSETTADLKGCNAAYPLWTWTGANALNYCVVNPF